MEYDSNIQSIHCYIDTDILINKYNIKDQDILNKVEADLSRKNLLLINLSPIKGHFDLKHLQRIHKAIFFDIYPFAGKIRTERISKGDTVFCYPENIISYADGLFKSLKNENYLIKKGENVFIKRLAYYMSEINMLHPFREGNGRTTREFIRLLALKCDYIIDWSHIPKNELLDACIASVTNTNLLEDAIRKVLIRKNH